MLKLGRLADYATLVMTQLAISPQQTRSAHDLAQLSRVAPPTVAKLMRLLARAGLVEAARGAKGGYRLARAPAEVSVADIVTAIEGPVALTVCAAHEGRCSIESDCGARSTWRLINAAIQQALKAVSLQQMADGARAEAARHALLHTTPLPLAGLGHAPTTPSVLSSNS
ncbi:MAG TPA: SUF system Fe-S cluster assembly regulator [Nevskiaceae bacterium]|nr:SUF system Fe-S cluster assembly regulator [Nevskiaceae bacterium]